MPKVLCLFCDMRFGKPEDWEEVYEHEMIEHPDEFEQYYGIPVSVAKAEIELREQKKALEKEYRETHCLCCERAIGEEHDSVAGCQFRGIVTKEACAWSRE